MGGKRKILELDPYDNNSLYELRLGPTALEKLGDLEATSNFRVYTFLFKDKKLSNLDIIILSKIETSCSFYENSVCTESNKNFGKFFNTSQRKIRESIAHLIELEYLEREVIEVKDHGTVKKVRILRIGRSMYE